MGTFTAPRTVPRRVLGFSYTSLGEGFTTWIRKHVLEASTRVLATWRFPGTGTLRGSTKALELQAGPVTTTLVTELEGARTGYALITRTKPEKGLPGILASVFGC